MTLNELLESDKLLVTPADIAEVLAADPQTIRNLHPLTRRDLGFLSVDVDI